MTDKTIHAPKVGDRVYLSNEHSGIVQQIYRAASPMRELFYLEILSDSGAQFTAGASEIIRTEPKAATSHMPTSEAKSVCICGHTGDGSRSQHAGVIGHGACMMRKCTCQKFTWARFIDKDAG